MSRQDMEAKKPSRTSTIRSERRGRLVRMGIRLAAIALLMLGAGRALAAENEQAQRELFKQGAKLWPVYCAQCHNARQGSEFSPAQWNIIMMHMRTQANLPAQDARALTEYLKRTH